MTTSTHHTERRGEGPPGFSWPRMKQLIWHDATRSMEFAFGLFYYIFRGVFLLQFGYHESGFESFLASVHLSASRVGVLCVILGVLHIFAAATYWKSLRIAISVGGIALGVAINVAIYGSADPNWQAIAALWLSVILIECYIMLRNFMSSDDSD
jgi:hypothetical protein